MSLSRLAAVAAVSGIVCCVPPARADVTITLAPSLSQPEPDQVRFDLLVLNGDAAGPGAYAAPATLPCRLTTPGGIVDVTATRVAEATAYSLNPGGFVRVEYLIRHAVAGRVLVELADQPAVATVVTVPTPGVSTTAAVTSRSDAPARQRNPLAVVMQRDPNFKSESGLVEFLSYRIKPHEPVYILAGDEDPSTKFQLSFKYQVFDPNGSLAQGVPALGGLYFGYSQTSLWDLGDEENSNPFFDTSYRPEVLVSYDNLDRFFRNSDGDRLLPDWLKLGVQAGLKHESNGRSGDESRSVNVVYFRPVLTLSGADGWFLTLAPGVYGYVFDLSDNPDIADYRGHADLRLIVGQGGGIQLAAIARAGDGLEHGSLQLDLSFPIRQLTLGNLDVYFHAQYFMGYGESLLRYDETDYSLRFGLSLVR